MSSIESSRSDATRGATQPLTSIARRSVTTRVLVCQRTTARTSRKKANAAIPAATSTAPRRNRSAADSDATPYASAAAAAMTATVCTNGETTTTPCSRLTSWRRSWGASRRSKRRILARFAGPRTNPALAPPSHVKVRPLRVDSRGVPMAHPRPAYDELLTRFLRMLAPFPVEVDVVSENGDPARLLMADLDDGRIVAYGPQLLMLDGLVMTAQLRDPGGGGFDVILTVVRSFFQAGDQTLLHLEVTSIEERA